MRGDQPNIRPKRRTTPDMLPFDWRWIVVLLLGLVFARRYSPILMIMLLLSGAYVAIRAGMVVWRDGPWKVSGPRETYWRGRRIDLPATPSSGAGSILQRALAALADGAAASGRASLTLGQSPHRTRRRAGAPRLDVGSTTRD
jgi:hypothetical protein